MRSTMKRLIAAVLALFSVTAFAATLTPIQSLNPAGSTGGQVIASTGASSAPAWANVSAAALTGIMPIVNGGTGASTASAALTNLGAAPLSNPAFPTGLSTSGDFNLNYTAPTQRAIKWFAGSNERWQIFTDGIAESGGNAGSNLAFARFNDAGSYIDSPINISRSTGAAAFNVRPIFAGNTPYDTGNLTIANYLTTASAASTYATIAQATTALAATGGSLNGVPVGSTTPAAGGFTTLSASSNDALFYLNTAGQTVANNTLTTVTAWAKTFDRVNANFNASTGVFTAPVTGIYQLTGQIQFASATGVVNAQYSVSVLANAVSIALPTVYQQSVSAAVVAVQFSALVSLTAGQTLSIQAYQNTGASRTLNTSSGSNYISINRVP